MEDEDRKILTEFLGECWHELDQNVNEETDIDICIKCGQHIGDLGIGWDWRYLEKIEKRRPIQRTFDTWEDFGALWDAVIESNRLLDFLDEVNVPDDEIYDMRSGVGELLKHIIDIDRFPFLVSKAIKEGVIK